MQKTKNNTKKIHSEKKKKQSPVLEDAWRYYAFWGFIAFLFSCLVIGALYRQVLPPEKNIQRVKGFTEKHRTLMPERGIIYDRNMFPLAISSPMKSISFNPAEYVRYKIDWTAKKKKIIASLPKLSIEEIKKKKAYIKKQDTRFDLRLLASRLDYDYTTLQKRINLTTTKKMYKGQPLPVYRFVPLTKLVSPVFAKQVMDWKFVGVHDTTHYKRFYLQAEPNAQTIGHVGEVKNDHSLLSTEERKKLSTKQLLQLKDDTTVKGRSGLEMVYDNSLAGKAGELVYLRGASGFGVVSQRLVKPEEEGQNVITSLDSRLQYTLYNELAKVGVKYKARSASGIIVDVRTGEVIGMSNWPSFNQNIKGGLEPILQRNRVISDSFEPGSVVKPLSVLAGLEYGAYKADHVIDTKGIFRSGKYTIRERIGVPHTLSVSDVVQRSSNTGAIHLGRLLPKDGVTNMYKKLGFGKSTTLRLPFQSPGIINEPKKDNSTLRASVTYGYSMETTLAQLAQAYTTIAARGIYRPLTMIKQDIQPQGKRIIQQTHADSILSMLEKVTYKPGTAPQARINGYRVGGKTGTALKFNPTENKYYDNKYRMVFVGTAPISDPRYVVAIVVEDPTDAKEAGVVAAPVFQKVMQKTLTLNGVPMDKIEQ